MDQEGTHEMNTRGGWLWGRDGSAPGWYGSWGNLNELPSGEHGFPWHGRASVHSEGGKSTLSLEWRLGLDVIPRIAVNLERGGDHDVLVSIGLPPFALYFGVEHHGLGRWFRRLGLHHDREVSVSAHDTSIWWRLWAAPNDWSSRTPRWRDGSLNLDRMLRGEALRTTRELHRQPVVVPLPERSYCGVATVEEIRVDRPRWPTERIYVANITMDPGQQIPIPGKWSDSDAIFSCGSEGPSVARAVGDFVGNVLRRRNGWVPPAESTEALAEG